MIETIILIFFVTVIVILKLKYKKPTIPIEAFDHKAYLVNDLPDSQDASDMLAKIMAVLNKLVINILKDYGNGKLKTIDDKKYIGYVKQINSRLPYVKISENPTGSKFTSYSINKGEELVFCIRDKISRGIHEINELLYVAIHEIAHIGCPEVGHTELFKDINIYLLSKAVCYGLYNYIDYYKYNKKYCGMVLTTTILSDANNIDCIFIDK
jgi:hypothetical protein